MDSSNNTSSTDQAPSRKRPVEEEASSSSTVHKATDTDKAATEPNSDHVGSHDAAAASEGQGQADNGEDEKDSEQHPAKRARVTSDNNEQSEHSTDKESHTEEKHEEGAGTEDIKNEHIGTEESAPKPLFSFTPKTEGFACFSSMAPLSFSSVLGDTTPLPSNTGSGPLFSFDFSSPSAFGSLSEGSATPTLSATGFALSSPPATEFSFTFDASSSKLFSTSENSPLVPVAEKVPVVTGEENEDRVHSVRAKLLKLDQQTQTWKERGCGQLHLNVAKDGSYTRLVMRAEGVLRLILNTALLPHTLAKRVQDKSVQLSAVEDEKPVLYLLRLSRREEADDLFAAINRHLPK